jgi:periplasmic copper chaperone A
MMPLMKHSPAPDSSRFRLLALPGIIFTALLLITPYSFASSAITLENAWISEAPPMSKVMAGYVKILNPGDKPVQIDKVSSPDFSSIEMHRTVIKNGVASMLRERNIHIAAHGSFEFKPGSYHLMMFNPKKSFRAGDSSQLTFTFASGQSETFKFTVKKATGYSSSGQH